MGIKSSVGKNATNNRVDVAYVQHLLNFHIVFNPDMRAFPMLLPGLSTLSQTTDCISVFQADVLHIRPESKRGRVEPNSQTLKALEGYTSLESMSVPPVPAPPADTLINNIRKTIFSDDYGFNCSLYLADDARSKRRKMFEILILPQADDSYLHPWVVRDYIEKTEPGVIPGPIRPSHVLQALLNKKVKTPRGILDAFNSVFDEVMRGLSEFGQRAEGVSMMKDTSAAEQTGMVKAILNVRDWFVAHRTDPNSIYYPLNLQDPVDYDPLPWFKSLFN